MQPQAIIAAAFKSPLSGRIFVADVHADAFAQSDLYQLARDSAGPHAAVDTIYGHAVRLTSEDQIAAGEGFMTGGGRFVSRAEAFELAAAAGQVTVTWPDDDRVLLSEHLPPR